MHVQLYPHSYSTLDYSTIIQVLWYCKGMTSDCIAMYTVLSPVQSEVGTLLFKSVNAKRVCIHVTFTAVNVCNE